MPRKMTKKTMKKGGRKHRGGGYGFGGSILGNNPNSSGAGNAQWNSTGGECGSAGRGGNDTLAGGRRRSRKMKGGNSPLDVNESHAENDLSRLPAENQEYKATEDSKAVGGRRRRSSKKSKRRRGGKRRTMKGGTLALQQPRAGYSFDGSGAGGMANAVPLQPNTTNV